MTICTTPGAADSAVGTPTLQGRRSRIWCVVVAVAALLSAPTTLRAESGFLDRLLDTALRDTARVPAPGPRLKSIENPFSWERIRESTQRLLEPDTRLLRYTARHAVSDELARKIVEEATAAGIDPELAFRLVRVESRFQPRARGPGGSLGLTQLMPATARSLDRSLRTEADILEPRTNLRLGFRYLARLIDRYDDVRLGLLAYNRGPGAVDRALRRGQDPENGYSRRVLGARGATRYTGPGRLPEVSAADSAMRRVER